VFFRVLLVSLVFLGWVQQELQKSASISVGNKASGRQRIILISTTISLLTLCTLTASPYFILLIKAPNFKQVDSYRILALSIYGTYYECVRLTYT